MCYNVLGFLTILDLGSLIEIIFYKMSYYLQTNILVQEFIISKGGTKGVAFSF
jgi:hypothetical protein